MGRPVRDVLTGEVVSLVRGPDGVVDVDDRLTVELAASEIMVLSALLIGHPGDGNARSSP